MKDKKNDIELAYLAKKGIVRMQFDILYSTLKRLEMALVYDKLSLKDVDEILDILREANNKILKIKEKRK